ncbi:response regulator transcription factor [Streptomyces pactum]|uniref:Response regulator transcription factor n=1 Tax=Streptomyces pactum TaxID=68249 RepID=A0ABS0NI95_9ACTN|nr:response regulator transcription factor [Streptomyces pactum]MBH5334920.1 response regulator transcription factor [Streptomyces pactum]
MSPPAGERTPDGADDDHAAHLERTLLQAYALIESTVSLHREGPRDPAAVVARTDTVPAGEALEELVGRARHSIGVVRVGTGEFADTVLRLLPGVPAGLPVRVLCATDAADPALGRYTRNPGARAEVRVCEGELREILVVDGAAALVRGAAESGTRATVVDDDAAARALELLFAGAWSRGRDLADHHQICPLLRTELARNVLERLSAGTIDEVAARDLKVSLRTYRRHVAEIMRELDANSRFQAGARAVELGLISP